ncbi:hypothetical protein DL93DRAFT_2057858 [Clavulina sp. PMI_390]|nr:hypothetical protein DL93DRAFT_2057858 [Clavulina sp. PMI_390]
MSDLKQVGAGECVVYWMRNEDIRLEDNRALEHASKHATKHSIPLVVLFVISPGDYRAHDRSPRRIDFMLRNLRIIQASPASLDDLDKLNIPLHVLTQSPRKTIPKAVVELARSWGATQIFGNIEYEVDELRRDMEVVKLCNESSMRASFLADKLIVEPGKLATKQGKQYAVYTPWLRSWTEYVRAHPAVLKEFSSPKQNDKSIRNESTFKAMFATQVPESVLGFECEDAKKMTELWPAGITAARKMFEHFLHSEARSSQLGDNSPLEKGASKADSESSRMARYKDDRNRCDIDSSSRMSPYLASGIISARELIRTSMAFANQKQISPDRSISPGCYMSEVAWRDFYTHVMVAFPRVSMGRPYLEKFADVKWEKDGDMLEAWKKGMTGVPIVDAAMRQAVSQGWMHNRARMIAAMFLTKDLMMDWRLGEQFFMQQFVDGDLASNNGGWQWSASTGTDPQPYFRIFNPYAQAEKADPTGDYIRHFVPELRDLRGKAIYDPHSHLEPSAFKKLGYPKPIIDHAEGRDRALRRYKNPGEE